MRFFGLRFHWVDIAATAILAISLMWVAFDPEHSSLTRQALRVAFLIWLFNIFFLHTIQWGFKYRIRLAAFRTLFQAGKFGSLVLVALAVLAAVAVTAMIVFGFWSLLIGGAMQSFDWADGRELQGGGPYERGKNEILSGAGFLQVFWPQLQDLNDGVYRGILSELALWAGQIAGLGIVIQLAYQLCSLGARLLDKATGGFFWSAFIGDEAGADAEPS